MRDGSTEYSQIQENSNNVRISGQGPVCTENDLLNNMRHLIPSNKLIVNTVHTPTEIMANELVLSSDTIWIWILGKACMFLTAPKD